MSSEGEFEEVVSLLQAHVLANPHDAESWLMLVEHSYWTGDLTRTRRLFDSAIQRNPHHEDLHLSYARFLMETGDFAGASRALLPLRSGTAEAEVIRGTIAWWSGYLGRAQRHFREALRLDDQHEEAEQSLQAIRAGARPWLRIRGDRTSDTQPLASLASGIEVGFYLSPLHTIGLDARSTRFELAGPNAGATDASLRYRGYWPIFRLESEIGGGAVFVANETHLTGSFRIGARLADGMSIDASWHRTPYRYTLASVLEPVLKTDLQLRAVGKRYGWLAESAGRLETFPDGNQKRVLYGWILAPVLSTSSFKLHAGYAFGYQDTDEHRFAVTMTATPTPNRPPRWEGQYVPYHTPLSEQVHSATGNVQWRLTETIALTAGAHMA
jgi:tetratricopeptide (TPR) repeat protein